MSKVRFTLHIVAAAAFTLALAAVSHAQATRTWVSGVGDDANPCSRTAPCKTYAGAISKTAKDGEISTLDPGGFGAVTITKSITIQGTTGQGYGSILASATTGVIVNITDVNDLRKTVRLNWLDINGAPSSSPGLSGIRVLSANVVHVENTVIDSFRSASAGFGHGIHVNTSGSPSVNIRNTTIRNCLNDGIRLEQTGAGQIQVTVSNSKIADCANGIKATNGTVGMIADTTISNCGIGIDAEEGAQSTQLNIEGCRIAFCGTAGIQAGAGASEVRISNNFIAQNAVGVSIAGGTVFTSGNNRLQGNPTPVGGGGLQPVTQPQ